MAIVCPAPSDVSSWYTSVTSAGVSARFGGVVAPTVARVAAVSSELQSAKHRASPRATEPPHARCQLVEPEAADGFAAVSVPARTSAAIAAGRRILMGSP